MKGKLGVSLSGFEGLEKKVATQFRKRIKSVLENLALDAQMLSVHLCDDAEIRELNRRFRKKNKATDVLSFEGDSELFVPVLGDIVISIDTAHKQAEELGHTLLDELSVLFVHGLLHLLGYDHEKGDDEATRHAEAEMFILSAIDVPVERALVAR